MSNYLGFQPSDNSKYYFVSYNNEDANRVGPIAKELSDGGISLWYDYGIEYGDYWEHTIAKKIRNSEAVILFFSKGILSKTNSFVQKEFKMATRSYNKKVIVIMMDNIMDPEVPDDKQSWWYDLTALQCINAFLISNTADLVSKIADAIGEHIQRQTTVPSSEETASSKLKDRFELEKKKIISRYDPAIFASPEALLELQLALEDISDRWKIDKSRSDSAYLSDKFKYKSINDSEVIVTGYSEDLHSVRIPERINGKLVVAIDKHALNKKSLESIYIPASITKIDPDCLRDCRNLREIIIAGEISILPEGLFANCGKLKRVILPTALKEIRSYAFAGCSELSDITIPDTVQYIGDHAFSRSGLTSLNIPDSVKVIGPNAFEECIRLTSIKLSGSLKVLPERLFLNCSALRTVYIPDGISEIKESAFMECRRLCEIDSLINVKTIGYAAFQNCGSLRSLIIPNIEFMSYLAFSGCVNLTEIVCPDSFLTSDYWKDTQFWKNRI
ncbi:MAG: leucine-rich repeat protein [Lachnospiraceae bacterium]|nr:leucine-rich repeat protein [Lachnospiraceae bacterium]